MDAISDDLNLVVTDISSAGQFWIEKIRNNINPKLTDLKNLVELTPRVQLDWLRQTFTAHVSSAKHLLEITYKIVGLCVQAGIIDEVFDELIGMRRVSFSKTDNVSTICVLCNIISDFLNDITLQSEFDVLTDAIVSVLSTRNVGIHSKRITIWFYSRAADQIDKKTNSKLFRSSKQLVNAQQMFESISKFHLSTEAIAYEALWHESILSYLSISQILIKNTNTLNELVRFTEVLNAAEFLNGFEKFSGSAQSDEPNEQIDKLEHTLANVSSLIMDLRMKLTELDKSTDDIGICSAA